jgi:hypothetical protein
MNEDALAPPVPLTRAHRVRLLQVWRSAGWPHCDTLDLDLLAAALVTPQWDGDGRETLRLTPSGIKWLAAMRQDNRRSAGPHDRLAERVARKLMETGRLVWRELSLRARIETNAGGAWKIARPDVFSIRNTSVEAYLHPIVHEVKVSRADLLGELRNPAKSQAYAWLCCECYYVFPAGVASADDIPEEFGVWVLNGEIDGGSLELVRPARHSACSLPFAVWMSLAKSTPLRADPEQSAQGELGDC